MIYEFAVSPSICGSWQNLRFLLSSFGKEEGRLLSDIPQNKWISLADKTIKTSKNRPVERKRMFEGLLRLAKKSLYKRDFVPQIAGEKWIDHALAAHKDRPFRAILTTPDHAGNEDFILKNDIDLPEHGRWKQSPSKTINRKKADMVNEIRPLLENARQVMLIDRNFCLVDRNGNKIIRYKPVLLGILNALRNKRYGPTVKKVIYHVGDKNFDQKKLKQQCELYLQEEIPCGMTLQFVIWPWDELHDRFVLTDIGGIDFGQGLDEWTGHGPEKVKLSRISDDDFHDWWSKCNKNSYILPNFTI